MKRILDEQINSMFKLLYGKKYVTDRINSLNTILEQIDEPKKADLVKRNNLQDFYNTLNDIDQPLFQQKYGGMEYQKSVEAVQIGLILLGYQLPRFGVDGLFGPETAIAVNKFKKDNNISDDEQSLISEGTLIAPVPIQKVTSGFNVARHTGNHAGIDLRAASGTPIKSPADGEVIDARFKEGACGGTIQVQHADNFKSRFCHCKEILVNIGDKVKQGDILGKSGGAAGDKGAGRSTGAHLHFELKKGNSLVNPLDYIDSEIGSYDFKKQSQTSNQLSATITPKMVELLVNKLKTKNITASDIEKYIDAPVYTSGSVDFTDLDLSNDADIKMYSDIAQKFINTRGHNFLNITGVMVANGAKSVYERYSKYVPPELSLSQMAIEGAFVDNPKATPIVTKNPYNVGNTGRDKKYFNNVQEGINSYFELISKNYLVKGKRAAELVKNFVNKNGNRYAKSNIYEKELQTLIPKINAIAKEIISKKQ